MKHNERSDQLFLERMMTVAELLRNEKATMSLIKIG